jgi:uncharacterized protein
MPGRVARISIAPVKALGLVHPEAVDLVPNGAVGDRRFWLVDADDRLVNLRRHPRLMHVRPAWDEAARTLRLDFPDGSSVDGVVGLGASETFVMYKAPHPSRHVIGPWQEAISRYAGEPLRLLWSESGAADRMSYGGGVGAVSLVSRESLERLRRQLGTEQLVDGRRFRMLFEIDGVSEHGEDEWIGTRVQIGAAEVEFAGDVGRCVITTLDPDRAVRDLDTLGALAEYRREGRTEPLPLGVYGAVAVPGRVCVGDPVALAAPAASPSVLP